MFANTRSEDYSPNEAASHHLLLASITKPDPLNHFGCFLTRENLKFTGFDGLRNAFF